MSVISFVLLALFSQSDCKILRNSKNDFFARFKLVDPNSRIKVNCIRNITKYTSPKECSLECVNEEKCQSFNRHKYKGFCELLAISKFNESGLLQRDLNWVHFETNDDEQNVGSNCIELKPCQSYEVCEDTMECCNPVYKCRCRDGFEGKKCQTYTGPGSTKSNPAASCGLLMLKYSSVPDDEYWFKDQGKKIRCERKVDGRYTPWSLFGPCKHIGLCGNGTRQRKRTCTNPPPKGGGRSCDHFGPIHEIRPCQNKCPDCSANYFFDSNLTVKHGHLFATIGKMLAEYKIQFDFKIDPKDITSTHKNLIEFSKDGKENYRNPSLYVIMSGEKVQIHGCIRDKDNGQHCFNANKDMSFFTQWIHIEISQQKMPNNKYELRAALNGIEYKRFVNPKPGVYSNMGLYLSQAGIRQPIGTIRNLYLEGVCDIKRNIEEILIG